MTAVDFITESHHPSLTQGGEGDRIEGGMMGGREGRRGHESYCQGVYGVGRGKQDSVKGKGRRKERRKARRKKG